MDTRSIQVRLHVLQRQLVLLARHQSLTFLSIGVLAALSIIGCSMGVNTSPTDGMPTSLFDIFRLEPSATYLSTRTYPAGSTPDLGADCTERVLTTKWGSEDIHLIHEVADADCFDSVLDESSGVIIRRGQDRGSYLVTPEGTFADLNSDAIVEARTSPDGASSRDRDQQSYIAGLQRIAMALD